MRKLGEQWIEKAEDGKMRKMRLINGDCIEKMKDILTCLRIVLKKHNHRGGCFDYSLHKTSNLDT